MEKVPIGPICPECAQGKHKNCDGTAYDMESDEVVICQCEEEPW